MGVDEFGREHLIAEAPPGRLGIALSENERGFIIVQGFNDIPVEDEQLASEANRQRLIVLRQVVQIGDRLVAIDGGDVIHFSLQGVIARLGKLSAKKRHLTFARYHPVGYDSTNFDVEKLVLARVPSGPLGLILSDVVKFGAVIGDFQQLPNKLENQLKMNSKLHRGCKIVNINGMDVSKLPREKVTSLLAGMKDQEKEIVFYRMTPSNCAKISHLQSSSPEELGFAIDDAEKSRCVVAKVDATIMHDTLEVGDVLIGVNGTDITAMSREAAMEVINQAPTPKTLTFYHVEEEILPECHRLQIDAGPSGLNLDSNEPQQATITGFTTPEIADRPTFRHLSEFIPGSYIISINGVDVHQHTLGEVSQLFSKLRHASKEIVVGNAQLMRNLQPGQTLVTINVPPGPLGIKFDGGRDDVARVSGFNVVADGRPGVIEQSRNVPVGSRLISVNKMNLTCLTMSQTIELLQKLALSPKELTFSTGKNESERNPRTVSIQVPPGPLGLDLKATASNGVMVDRVNDDSARGPTHIFQHGGVVTGSEILSIDGFDVSSLQITEVSHLLRLLVSHEKTITFSTTTVAYNDVLNPARNPALKCVVITKSPMGIEFDSSLENVACTTNVATSDSNEEIPMGSRLIAIENVDVRMLSLLDIIGILRTLAGIQKTMTFDTTHSTQILSKSSSSPAAIVTATPTSTEQPMRAPTTSETGVETSIALMSSPSLSAVSTPSAPSPLTIKASLSRPPPLQIDPPTAPLSEISIRTLDASKASTFLNTSNAPVEILKASRRKTEFMIMVNPASWSGSRSSNRLVIDKPNKLLRILPENPSSPRALKEAPTIHFDDILSLESSSSPQTKRGLFRSLSSKKGLDDRSAITLTSNKTKNGKKKPKVWEFSMRSSSERDELEAILIAIKPAEKSG